MVTRILYSYIYLECTTLCYNYESEDKLENKLVSPETKWFHSTVMLYVASAGLVQWAHVFDLFLFTRCVDDDSYPRYYMVYLLLSHYLPAHYPHCNQPVANMNIHCYLTGF